MRDKSAGMILYRFRDDKLEVLVCHPGGPYGKGPDQNKWSLPKGGIEPNETPIQAAIREMEEETGICQEDIDQVWFLGIAKQTRKDVHVYAALYIADGDPEIKSNQFELEWPRGSGEFISVPEIDRGEFVSPDVAKHRLIRGQDDMIDELIMQLGVNQKTNKK
jgi:predicted NUDIX family NTP pyrophosphohydrolase